MEEEYCSLIKKTMVHSDNNYVGFNQNGDYFSSIPDNEVFSTIKTYFPGVCTAMSLRGRLTPTSGRRWKTNRNSSARL